MDALCENVANERLGKKYMTMQRNYTVCFFGHRELRDFDRAEARTEKLLRTLIQQKPLIEFLVGREGEYDQIAASTVRRLKRELSSESCWLTWVLPYTKAELENNLPAFEAYYDSIEVCESSSILHPKAAIQARNRSIVDRSDLCVFYIERQNGGAWNTMRYALKRVVNLADEDIEAALSS